MYDISALFNNNFVNTSFLVYSFSYLNNIGNFFNIFFLIFFLDYRLVILKNITINLQLVYGYNGIHPFILYLTAVIFFFKIFQLTNLILFVKLRTITIFYFLTLLLGGMWGVTNSSWGFFWLNDPIEITLLAMCLMSLWLLHVNLNYKINFVIFFFSYFIVIYVIAFRTGFLLTRHNFFNLNNIKNLYYLIFFFFNHKLSFKIFYVPTLIFFFFLNKYYIILYVLKQTLKKFNNFSIIFIFIHIVILVLLLSFLRYRENNISLFNYINKIFLIDNFFYFFNNQSFNLFYVFTKNIVLKLYLSFTQIYNIKVSLFFFTTFLSYWNFFFFLFFLISNIKIVPK